MPDPVWDQSGKAREALRTIVTDYGTRALSSPSILDNVLRDLLPDSPRQVSLIVAAGGSPVATSLQEHVAQGIDADTAVRLASAQMAEQTPLDADGCRWVTTEFALALGLHPTEGGPGTSGWAAPAPAVAPTPPPAAPVLPEMPPPAAIPPRPDQAETVLPPVVAPAPDAGPDGRAKPKRRRLVLVSVALILVIGLAVGLVLAFSGSSTPPISLRKLMPNDATACETHPGTPGKLTGLIAQYGCNEAAINGFSFGYQFDNHADYVTSVAEFNKDESFDLATASHECPIALGPDEGTVGWHSPTYPSVAGQRLECFTVSQNHGAANADQPSYIWTAPTLNVIFQVVGGPTTSMKSLDTWWSAHAGP